MTNTPHRNSSLTIAPTDDHATRGTDGTGDKTPRRCNGSCGTCRNTNDEPPHRGPLVALDAEDRRKFPRRNIRIHAHVLGQSTARFLAATTLDMSAGGVLLSIDGNAHLDEGELVAVGLDESGRSMFDAERLITARVVRCFAFEDTTRVAVEFDRPQAGLMDQALAA